MNKLIRTQKILIQLQIEIVPLTFVGFSFIYSEKKKATHYVFIYLLEKKKKKKKIFCQKKKK